ncbi:natterin-3-like [Cyprinodon tularosa]|uniref:natterin-3-like n=1 Tax=Cyprinodon tularosa TaxID=77115 RepID=UPI0018E27819|nr:natterin-3-like [Cyprinodon tularosa]
MLLLSLTLASLQDKVGNQSANENVLSLNQNPVDGAAKMKAIISISKFQHVLPLAKWRKKRPVNSKLSTLHDQSKMRWAKWEGFLPNGAVSIYNNYVDRIDYVCKVRCLSGFYTPSMGAYCHYPDNKKELRSSSFQILVNEDNFEILEWKEDSYGSVPKTAVSTCSNQKIYVGKNKYGLGKVDPKDECFYLPWEGQEYWYRHYEVLTHWKAEKDLISSVKYKTDQAKIFKEPPKALQTSTAINYNSKPVKKTVTLTKTTKDERRWDTSSSFTVGVRVSIKVGIPLIVDKRIELSAETTHVFSKGNTWIEEISHSASVELTVPPSSSCRVNMVAFLYKVDIPFTAILNRTYEDGETRSVVITGTYDGVQTGEIMTEIEECKPLFKSRSFPYKINDILNLGKTGIL